MNRAPPPKQGHGLNVDIAPHPPKLFSLRNALIVIPLLGVLVFMVGSFFPIVKIRRLPDKKSIERSQFFLLSVALESYRYDFGCYPPENTPSAKVGENLWHYLAQPITVNSKTYGPYLDPSAFQSQKVGQYQELLPKFGGSFEYKVLNLGKDGSLHFELVDPGLDQKLGGYIDPEKGFVKTSADADDNITTESN